ncbi:MAG: hypothetical protein HC792_05355 [Acaryochloridaceae cyanobacterium CSU_5_19]|nr:hypothetical protein [Acaryochloridaceae cyanobacterium CSU_5_19]
MIVRSSVDTQLGSQQRVEYQVCQPLNIFDSPKLTTLATQAWPSRYLQVYIHDQTNPTSLDAFPACLCEDNYPGWIDPQVLTSLEPVLHPYQSPCLRQDQIELRLPQVIAF